MPRLGRNDDLNTVDEAMREERRMRLVAEEAKASERKIMLDGFETLDQAPGPKLERRGLTTPVDYTPYRIRY